MTTLDEIKQLMAAGETAQADEALKELLAAEPNNLQAKMLYGTCRQLLGDEETFRRIYDELAPVMGKTGVSHDAGTTVTPEAVSLWRKYQTQWEYLVLGALVLGAAVAGIVYFGRCVNSQNSVAIKALATYGGPQYDTKAKVTSETNVLPSQVKAFGASINVTARRMIRNKDGR